MDLEGFAKRMIECGVSEAQIMAEMTRRIMEIKDISEESAARISKAVIEEAKCTLPASEGCIDSDIDSDYLQSVLKSVKSGVRVGEFGVGSRGRGDFHTHQKIADIIGKTSAVADSSTMSDSGVVRIEDGRYIVVTVDGIHSRLSDFPFLAGFHVARAALRDVYVMGARPLALFSDIHVADDADVAKIFEHIAGISAVSEAVGVPLITGSTLRIGGDMVIGTRMTGCAGAVGVATRIFTKSAAKPGDIILMSEGAGGGTISTAALYNGEYDVVRETLNIKFLKACDAIIKNEIKIHTMTDITNGGIRGDANEIASVSGVKLVFYEEKIRSMVDRRVLDMLEKLKIDYLGVSLDSLLVICPENEAEEVRRVVERAGVRISEVGFVSSSAGEDACAEIVSSTDGTRRRLEPRFRESAYTPLKKVVGENVTETEYEKMRRLVESAAEAAIRKKELVKMMLLTRSHEES